MLLGAFSVVFFVLCLQILAFFVRNSSLSGVCNDGGAFGLGFPFWLLTLFFIGAVIFFLFEWWRVPKGDHGWPWLFLVAAGTSNMLERLVHGCVFDFIHVPFFPSFNGADVILSLSVVFLLWKGIRQR